MLGSHTPSPGSDALPPAHARLQASVATGALDGWDAAWREDWTPWDAAAAQPALVWALSHAPVAQLLPPVSSKAPALVAGMGRGYDAALLAQHGYSPVVGVDISPTAVAAASAWRDAHVADASVRARIHLHTHDFFALGTPGADPAIPSRFALAYDYTFLCALHPSMRRAWASTYARVIRPGGILLALVYPIHGPRTDGPPFSLSPQIYAELLSDAFELVWAGVPLQQSDSRRGTGVEQLNVWRHK